MPVLDHHAFVFTDDGHPGPRARTLKEFMGLLASLPKRQIEGHLRRHDISRWMTDVFRDAPLAAHVRTLEDRVAGAEDARDIAADIGQAIRARYDVAEAPEEREAT
jgi:hypothetical protein